MAQAAELTRLLTERKKQEHLPGRARDMVAKRLEMSAGAIGELLTINNNLPERLKQAFKEEKITKSVAVKLSKLEDKYKEEFEKMLTSGTLEVSQITSRLIEDRIRKFDQNEHRQNQQPANEKKKSCRRGTEKIQHKKKKNRERDIAKLEVLLKVLNEMWRELADGAKSYAFPEQARYDAANYLGQIKAELQKEWIILKDRERERIDTNDNR